VRCVARQHMHANNRACACTWATKLWRPSSPSRSCGPGLLAQRGRSGPPGSGEAQAEYWNEFLWL
jgi:hypothetical protein